MWQVTTRGKGELRSIHVTEMEFHDDPSRDEIEISEKFRDGGRGNVLQRIRCNQRDTTLNWRFGIPDNDNHHLIFKFPEGYLITVVAEGRFEYIGARREFVFYTDGEM